MTGHTFGGSHLDRLVFDFMPDDGIDAGAAMGDASTADTAVGDAGAAAAGDPAAAGAEPGSSPAASDGAAAAAPEPASTGIDPRELEAELAYLREQNQMLARQFQQFPTQTAGQDDGPPDFDPLDPDSMRAYMAWERQQTINEMRQLVSPLSQTFEQQRQAELQAEGEQRVNDVIADDIARNGEFVTGDQPDQIEADKQARQLVRTLAEQMFPTIAERYGVNSRAGELAVAKAAEQVRALLRAAGKTAVVQNDHRLATLAEGHGAAAGGAAAVTGQPAVPLSPSQLAAKYGRTA